MDIECYNRIAFFGNPKVDQKIEAWKSQIKSQRDQLSDPLGLLIVSRVFKLKAQDGDSNPYGCGWIYPGDDEMLVQENEICFVTDGGTPDGLQVHMATMLYKIDPNVVIRNRYTLNTGSEGFVYMAPTGSHGVHTEKVYVDLDEYYAKYDSGIEAEEASELQLKAFEIEAVYDMISDVPGTEETFRKYVKDVDIDWDFIDERKSWDSD